MDEMPLKSEHFRVLANFWRRAGADDTCWPSAKTIAKDCRIKRSTVFAALKELEARGLVVRIPSVGTSNNYKLVVPKEDPGPQTALPPVPETALRVVPETALEVVPQTAHKGTPRKEPHLKNPKEGKASLSFSLSEEEAVLTMKDCNVDRDGLPEIVRIYAEIKSPWVHKDGPLSAGGLRAFLRTHQIGKDLAVSHRRDRYRYDEEDSKPAFSTLSKVDAGPEGWQEFVDRVFEGSPHATGGRFFGPWDTKDSAARSHIESEMRKASKAA